MLVRHDSLDNFVIEIIYRHSGIDDQSLRIDSRGPGAEKEAGRIGGFLGGDGRAAWNDLFSK